MKRILLILTLFAILSIPAGAVDYTAPPVDGEAKEYYSGSTESFGADLWAIMKKAVAGLNPSIGEASRTCACVIAIAAVTSLLQSFPGAPAKTVELGGMLSVSIALISSANSLIRMGADTVSEISEYGKLLLPVMTGALAAQGGATSSVALYTGTAIFNSFLSGIISRGIVPMLYIFLCLCIADCAIGDDRLKNMKNTMKWAVTWVLKIVIYVFTGYIAVTGVIGGSADALAIKATKIAISGSVPVVGSIVSDASEAVLVGAGIMKNSVGVYGMLALVAILIGPFLRICVQYLFLKLSAAICGFFLSKKITVVTGDFSTVMGFLLSMTGVSCLLLMISVVCFMKGLG